MNEIALSTLKYTAPFIAGFIIKSFLDFESAAFLVKRLSLLPTRWIYRSKETNISGMWEQKWEVESENYPKSTDRHGHTEMKQFFKYCYAEFYSRGEKYVFFGKLNKEYLTGRWYSADDENGYFGTFELLLKNSNSMSGMWIGHSKETRVINTGKWHWRRLPK
ncbi:hypothetical protein [Geothermobacter ehrlichii]|uniref:hypothetical protein n=1 Tax=Geothermobacter ehrlichii TaxID=213224 RepID=UPI0011E757AE|nr:hypothetical protein [Geothermobacter ehrlichii]